MGWKDIFRSKTIVLKPDAGVRWFGKLPSYGDYFRSPSKQDWAVEFVDWTLKGYQAYQSRLVSSGRARVELPPCGCVLRLPESGATVFASFRDYGGDLRGRAFPFCLFVGAATAEWRGPCSGNAEAFLRVLADLHALHEDLDATRATSEMIEDLYGGRDVDLTPADEQQSEPWKLEAESLSLERWLSGLNHESRDKDRADWLRSVETWGENLSRQYQSLPETTVRFPLAGGIELGVQVSGWLHWLQSVVDMGGQDYCVALSGDLRERQGHMSVIAKDLEANDFLLMTPLADTLSRVDDLSRNSVAGTPSSGGSELSLESSWLDFACRAGRNS